MSLFTFRAFFVLGCLIALVSCSSNLSIPPVKIESTPKEDGAPTQQRDITTIADAVPQPVVRTKAGNTSPYTVFGETYTLLPDSQGYQEQGYASWYGTKFHGRYTANGEIYDMWGMTAAHKSLPIPSYVRVVNLDNGHCVILRVNDRGPFHSDRIIDLSYAAAKKLGFAESGVALVEVTDVTPASDSVLLRTQKSNNVEVLPSTPSPAVNVVSTNAASVDSAPVTPNVPAAPQVTSQTLAEPMPKAIPAPQSAIAPITLQVGAFRQQSSASSLQGKLQQVFANNNVIADVRVELSQSNPPWHRVRVGPILDQQTLSTVKQLLAEQGIQSPQKVK